jgi:CBS domain-containing protein
MRVSDLMSRDVATARAEQTLVVVARLMREHDCGCVVVVDAEHRAIGVVTDRDVCLAVSHPDYRLDELRAGDAMQRQLFSCRPDDSIAAAEDAMGLHQVRRLPVVGAAGRLLGLLALDDIAREAAREGDLLAPPVSAAGVGRTLGQICRPRLVQTGRE